MDPDGDFDTKCLAPLPPIKKGPTIISISNNNIIIVVVVVVVVVVPRVIGFNTLQKGVGTPSNV
jgi:hypothetical protein